MIIYSPTGTAIIDAPVTHEAIIKFALMGDYYIELPFALDALMDFPRGAYIMYKTRRFEIMSTVRPEFDNKTGGYKYALQFHAQQNHMKRFVCFWLGGPNPEAVFHNTTDLASFGALIVANMNKSLSTENWQLGTVAVESPETTKLISFNGDKCWDALNTIAETFEVEWWTEENDGIVSLNFGKLNIGTPETFQRGDVVKNIPAKKGDDSSYGTRFYVFGSTRNLTSDYGQSEQGGATNHVSEIRLRLPNGQEYIDAVPNLPEQDIVEQVVFFDDIYPKNTETITSIEKKTLTPEEGDPYPVYTMVCNNTPFVPSDMIENETLGAHFTSGSLMGRNFELNINYNPQTWKPEDGFDKKFEIIAQTENTGDSFLPIPNENLKPEPGDTFVLTGVKLPQQRIDEAEQELLAIGTSYAAKHSSDTDVYDCETNPVYCHLHDKNYDAGQAVLLVGPQFGENGRLSRIQGFEKKLYDEYIATYTVGDNTPYSRFGSIESDVKAALYSQRIGITESGAPIYLITRYDGTGPTDSNTYSARRAMWEFANKQTADTFNGKMTFKAGAQFGDYAPGITGIGGYVDNKGRGELESLTLRRFLEAPEFRYNRIDITMGDKWSAPSAGVIAEVDTENRIITLKLEEGEIGSPRTGDICMGIFHSSNLADNATSNYDDSRGNRRFAGFATCYFRVGEILDTTTFGRFKYELRPVSTSYPTQFSPVPMMTFVGYGSFSDSERRASRYETRTYQRYLKDVDDWEFATHNIAAQFGDLSNLSVFGLSMSGYSAYLNNIYMSGVIQQFTPEGEEIPTIIDRGIWDSTLTYNKNDDVYWNNARWRCIQDGTTSEPSQSAEEWVLLEQAIVGPDGSSAIPVYRLSAKEPATPTGTALPPEGWSLDVPNASNIEAVWMSMATVKDNSVLAWSKPSRISGKDGEDGQPGNWTSYIFKESNDKPDAPSSTNPIPPGWLDAPTGGGIWWMSKAAIDGTTGHAGAWSDPIRVTGEDGQPGPYTDFKYAKNNSNATAPALVKTDRNPAGWHDTPPFLSSGEYLWMTEAQIDANNNFVDLAKGWANPVRISGEKGDPGDKGDAGLQGCIVRITEWAEGIDYHNDSDLKTLGLRYIDVVTINNNGIQLKFQCKQTHLSSSANKPGATGGTSFWQQLNDMVPIYTPLLLADNAVINFLQGMQLLVHNQAGNIVAGMVGKYIPLFVGSSEPATSPFRVNEDGELTATKASIAGEINAESGILGGFKINKDNLTAQSSSYEMFLSAAAIKFEEFFSLTSVTIGAVANLGAVCPIKITNGNTRANRWGMYIDVPKGIGTNAAIYANTGDFYGFRPKSKYVDPGTHYLEKMDTVVLAGSENGNLTFYLPSNPEPNHLIVIRKLSDKNTVYVEGNGKQIVWNTSNAWVNSGSFTGRRAVSLLYSGHLGAWVQWISSN